MTTSLTEAKKITGPQVMHEQPGPQVNFRKAIHGIFCIYLESRLNYQTHDAQLSPAITGFIDQATVSSSARDSTATLLWLSSALSALNIFNDRLQQHEDGKNIWRQTVFQTAGVPHDKWDKPDEFTTREQLVAHFAQVSWEFNDHINKPETQARILVLFTIEDALIWPEIPTNTEALLGNKLFTRPADTFPQAPSENF